MTESERLRRELTTLAAMFDMIDRSDSARKVLDIAEQITNTGEGMPYQRMRDSLLELADFMTGIGRYFVANLVAILANEVFRHGSANARRVRPWR